MRLSFFSSVVAVFILHGTAAWADPDPAPIAETELVSRYLSATQAQQTTLRGGSMEVDIDATVPKLKKEGKLHALRNISVLGKITYHMLGFSGDNTVKKEIIARYLSAEVQAPSTPNLAITPENYKFKYKGIRDDDGRQVYVLHLSPRQKRVGLFKGELWLDAETYMPVRESGRFVKSPSLFLKKMEFVRTYEIENGVSIPQRLSSVVDTRFFGPVTLSINFGKLSKDPQTETAAVASAESDTQ